MQHRLILPAMGRQVDIWAENLIRGRKEFQAQNSKSKSYTDTCQNISRPRTTIPFLWGSETKDWVESSFELSKPKASNHIPSSLDSNYWVTLQGSYTPAIWKKPPSHSNVISLLKESLKVTPRSFMVPLLLEKKNRNLSSGSFPTIYDHFFSEY